MAVSIGMASSNEVELELGELLGKGGFGEVYRGIWKRNGSAVQAAIKSINTNGEQKALNEELQNEVNLLVQLNHLFTVRFLGCTSIESTWYIAMELCVGTLKQYVNNQLEDIPKGSADDKYLAGQIVIGLTYLHDKRIVHKDLKPDNILLWRSPSGLVLAKLADFGFSRQLPLDKLTFEDTTHLGTSGYIAPELWPPEKPVPTFASDVWALGVVLFYIFSDGQHPYGDRMLRTKDFDMRDMLIKKLKTPPNVSNIERQNWDAADLVLHLIDANPANRPNIRNVFIHPYFSLSNEGTKKQFLLNVHNSYSGSYKAVAELYSQSSIQNWYDRLDPHLKRQDIEEDLAIVQPILRRMKEAQNPIARQLDSIAKSLSPLGEQKKQVIEGEKEMIEYLDTLMFSFNPLSEVLRQLMEAGPRLITTYTWSHLKSSQGNASESVLMYDLIYSMFFLSATMFGQLVEMKLQRLEEHEKQFQLNVWFHVACMFGLPEIVLVLSCSGAKVNSKRSDGTTGLHVALMHKQASAHLVENLLAIGADPSIATDVGITALHVAALNNDSPEVVQLILDACKTIDANCCNWPMQYLGRTPKQLATLNPNPAIHNLFIESDCQVPLTSELMNPLKVAVMTKNVEKVQYFIKNRTNVNAVDPEGMTSLHCACSLDDDTQIVEMLLHAGADPNIQDMNGETALHRAVFEANTEIAKLLLDNPYNKANPNLKMTADERTCLHSVTSGQVMKPADYLLLFDNFPYLMDLGEIVGGNGDFPSLKEKVSPFLQEAINYIAPDYKFADKHVEMITILVKAGAHLDSRDSDGNTPLHCIAATSPNVETTRKLLELGADPKVCNDEGYTPLECAVHQNPCPEVTQELWFATFDDTPAQEKLAIVILLAVKNENPKVLELVLGLMGLA